LEIRFDISINKFINSIAISILESIACKQLKYIFFEDKYTINTNLMVKELL